jgi:hypothetical protein
MSVADSAKSPKKTPIRIIQAEYAGMPHKIQKRRLQIYQTPSSASSIPFFTVPADHRSFRSAEIDFCTRIYDLLKVFYPVHVFSNFLSFLRKQKSIAEKSAP